MPDRIIRQSIRTSPTIDMLSFEAESMFYRLTTVADDFGRFEADPRLLLSNCFPLKVDRLKIAQVSKWFDELVTSGLAKSYQTNGRVYGFLVNWAKHQRPRAKDSKFPEPPADENQLQTDASQSHSLSVESNISEQHHEPDNICSHDENICLQEETYVPVFDNRYSIIEKIKEKSSNELSSKTSETAPSFGECESIPYAVDEVIDAWNAICEKTGLSIKSTRGRKNPVFRKKIKLRLQENPERHTWDVVFDLIPKSLFLCGDKGWKITLDWLVENERHFVQVFEGQYNTARASPPSSPQETPEQAEARRLYVLGYTQEMPHA